MRTRESIHGNCRKIQELLKYPVTRSRSKICKFIRCRIKILFYKSLVNIFVTEKFAIFNYFIVRANKLIRLKKVLIVDKQ